MEITLKFLNACKRSKRAANRAWNLPWAAGAQPKNREGHQFRIALDPVSTNRVCVCADPSLSD